MSYFCSERFNNHMYVDDLSVIILMRINLYGVLCFAETCTPFGIASASDPFFDRSSIRRGWWMGSRRVGAARLLRSADRMRFLVPSLTWSSMGRRASRRKVDKFGSNTLRSRQIVSLGRAWPRPVNEVLKFGKATCGSVWPLLLRSMLGSTR